MGRRVLLAVLLTVIVLVTVALFRLCRENEEVELRRLVSGGRCPGYVVCTRGSGRENWSCVGWADVEARRPMDTHTVFRICSMTKSFVGALAAVLVDRGVVSLDEPVSKTFPGLTGEKASITLRHCLSMTAGFPEMCPSILKRGVNGTDHEEVLREMEEMPLAASPGTGFIYSNPSFEVAAAVLVRKTGKTVEELLSETFFRPLGMTETTFHPTGEMRSRLAAVYRMREDAPFVREKEALVVRLPTEGGADREGACGGLYSTPADVLKFYKMLARRGVGENGCRVMSDRAWTTIASKQTPPAVATWYSFGFFLKNGWLGHGGAYGTLAECEIEKGRVRMVFSQVSGQLVTKLIRLWRRVEDESEDEVSLTGSCLFEE